MADRDDIHADAPASRRSMSPHPPDSGVGVAELEPADPAPAQGAGPESAPESAPGAFDGLPGGGVKCQRCLRPTWMGRETRNGTPRWRVECLCGACGPWAPSLVEARTALTQFLFTTEPCR